MTEVGVQAAQAYDLAVDARSVWFQGNRLFGNMVEGLSVDWLANRNRAVEIIGGYTMARQVVRMKPLGVCGFQDLDEVDIAPIHHTDGFITTDSELILHANPADCGEVALHGFSNRFERPVVTLLHANRHIVGANGHLAAIDYMVERHDVDPAALHARLSPSARVGSYTLDFADPTQQDSVLWRDYAHQDDNGLWHVDFHQKTVDDLLDYGIPPENMDISPVDTAANSDYFSHLRFRQGDRPDGANGLLFALRG